MIKCSDFSENTASDPYNLARFVEAQADVYAGVLAELAAGRKCSHWMWFVFPQIDGLGSSSTARRFAIRSLDEAGAYLAHPVLGPRLVECCQILLGLEGADATAIFGWPDDIKLRSSMTLFARTPGAPDEFARVFDKFFAGTPDQLTLDLLGANTR